MMEYWNTGYKNEDTSILKLDSFRFSTHYSIFPKFHYSIFISSLEILKIFQLIWPCNISWWWTLCSLVFGQFNRIGPKRIDFLGEFGCILGKARAFTG